MKKKYITILTIMMIFIFSINIYADGNDRNISNLFLFNDKVNSTDEVDGDVYAFAQNISLGNNIVGGDIISAGQSISLDSEKVNGNIRIAGQDININVKETKNITTAGQSININKETNCNAIYAASQIFKFEGVTNELGIKAQDVIIDGIVKGNLDVECENLTIGESAKLLGSIKVKSPNEVSIYGNHNLEKMYYEKTILNNNHHHTFRVMPLLGSLTTAIIIGILIFILFKNYFNNCKETVSINIGKYILVGLCLFIVFPLLFLLLCISIIGIPIAIILLLLYILLLYISHIIVGIILGKFMLSGYNQYLQLICGIIAIKILILIPFIGFIIGLCSILFSLGLITLKAISLFR